MNEGHDATLLTTVTETCSTQSVTGDSHINPVRAPQPRPKESVCKSLL